MARPALLAAIKLAFSAALLAWLWNRFDFGAAFALTLTLHPAFVALAFAVLLSHGVLSAWRWRTIVMLQEQALGWGEALRLFFIAMFFNQTLSTTVGGDAARVWMLHRKGTEAGQAVTGILLERVAGFLSLVPLALIGLFLLPVTGQNALGMLFAAAALLTAVIWFGERLHSSPRRWIAPLGRFAKTARHVLLSRHGLLVFSQSMLIHLGVGFAVYLLCRAADVSPGLLVCLTLCPPVLLLATFSITFGGWGLREAGLVWLFAFYDVAAEPSLALSITLGLLVMAAGLPGALLWVSRGRKAHAGSR